MKRIVLMAVLGLAAAPAFANDKPVALDDAALDKVSGGGDSVPVVSTTTNTNVSPIVVVQNAYSIVTQNGNSGQNSFGGQAPGNSAWGHQQGQGQGQGCQKKNDGGAGTSTAPSGSSSTGNVAQWASSTALNIATINYTVSQGH